MYLNPYWMGHVAMFSELQQSLLGKHDSNAFNGFNRYKLCPTFGHVGLMAIPVTTGEPRVSQMLGFERSVWYYGAFVSW